MWFISFSLAFAAAPDPGLYRLRTEVVTTSQVPLFGKTSVVTRTDALLELEGSAGELTARQQTCDIQVESSSRAATVIPADFVSALPPLVYSVAIGAEEFSLDGGLQLVGLSSAEVELPDSGRDPDVRDTDRDGHPGATIQLQVPLFGKIDVYVVQRTETRLVGALSGSGAQGSVEILSLEQRTIGASNPLFNATPRLTPVKGESRFWLEPVQPEASCDDAYPELSP